jgi:hypothetical protein
MTKNRLLLITAAAASIMAAAAPSAQAMDSNAPAAVAGLAGRAAGAAVLRAMPLAFSAVGDKLGQKLNDVQGTVTAGKDAVADVNDLVS